MSIDLRQVTSDMFSRLKTASAGSAVRAALGDGANSIVHAQDLALDDLPVRPFIAFRRGAVAGAGRLEMRIPTYRWFVYDDDMQGYWRINDITRLIEQAYPIEAINNGDTEVSQIGAETRDDALSLLLSIVQLAYHTRG